MLLYYIIFLQSGNEIESTWENIEEDKKVIIYTLDQDIRVRGKLFHA